MLRLGCLPLALASAGSLLGQTSLSCAEYLDLHESSWNSLYDTGESDLTDYSRTLASTWTISAESVERQNPDAFALLKYFAYFSNQDVWYELVAAAKGQDACPDWLLRVTATRLRFERTMQTLVRHSLIDVIPGSFRLHPCLHDWLLARANNPPAHELVICAATSVHKHLQYDLGTVMVFRKEPANARLLPHMRRLRKPCFRPAWISIACTQSNPSYIACLYPSLDFERSAERKRKILPLLGDMLKCRQPRGETLDYDTAALAHEYGKTLYQSGKSVEAEQPLTIAMHGFARLLGQTHYITLSVCKWLGLMYHELGATKRAIECFDHGLISIRAMMNKGDELPRLQLIPYLNCCYYRTRLESYNKAQHVKTYIQESIEIAQNFQSEEIHLIYNFLGTMLASCFDDLNAQQAFCRSFVQDSEGHFACPCAECDVCGLQVSTSKGWYVCRTCPDVDLCRRCMDLYNSKAELLDKCQAHAFFEATTKAPVMPRSNDPWLDDMRKLYGVDGSESEH